jgi:hypothetical protein
MAGTLTLNDLIVYLELGKSRAELQFRLALLGGGSDAERNSCESRLAAVQRQLDSLSDRMAVAGVVIAVPDEEAIKRLSEALSSSSAKDIADAIQKRAGEVYGPLAARGALIKRNFENRENIAKLALLMCGLQKDVRETLACQVRKGSLSIPVPILKGEEELGNRIAHVLGRMGMPAEIRDGSLVSSSATAEVSVEIHGRKVWVNQQIKEKLGANIRKIQELSPKIHLKNAVRQIKQFDEVEEKDFVAIQNEYLGLLKEQDELLREFNEEGKLSVNL